MKTFILSGLVICCSALSSFAQATKSPVASSPVESGVERSNPNIIYILADDMGYGDVQCLNPERGMIATPHMDRVAAEGMIFTDAHTTSSVCTPTRYGIITGRYNWRTWKQEHVLDGYGLPLIPTTRMTVPSFLNENGYATAMIGKWHLGLEIATINGQKARPAGGLKQKSLSLVMVSRRRCLTSARNCSSSIRRLRAGL